jgi:hypothetical protein
MNQREEHNMKTTILLLATSILLAGCASLEETYYVDHEFGKDSQMTWDMQVAYPDYRFVYDQDGNMKNPETLDGVTAENVMDNYHQTFSEKAQKIDVLDFGVTD